MGSTHVGRLGVGVVGTGRLWQARHRIALSRLAKQFGVTSIYDQVGRRAMQEAESLGCRAARSLTELVGAREVDVLYMLAPQWFGMYGAQLGCEARKPVYLAIPIASDWEGLVELARVARLNGNLVTPELARRFYPATLRLMELMATSLGAPRTIRGFVRFLGYDRYGTPGPSTQLAPLPPIVDPGANVVDWCRCLFQEEPISVRAERAVVSDPMFSGQAGEGVGEASCTLKLEFREGRSAEITIAGQGSHHREGVPTSSRAPGFEVIAERGDAWLVMPDVIEWRDGRGTHKEHLQPEAHLGEILNDHFHRAVRGEQSLSPRLEDALAAAYLTGLLQRSLAEEGRPIAVEPFVIG